MLATAVTFLCILLVFGFLIAAPVVESKRSGVPPLNDTEKASLDAINAALASYGLKGETFFNDKTNMFCESIQIPKTWGFGEASHAAR